MQLHRAPQRACLNAVRRAPAGARAVPARSSSVLASEPQSSQPLLHFVAAATKDWSRAAGRGTVASSPSGTKTLPAAARFLSCQRVKTPEYQARRATLDDLAGLRELWRAEKFSEAGMEKRVPEFQLVQTANGGIVGALGLRVVGTQGLLYGESIGDFALTDTLRPLLWERMLTVARNRGLARLWTQNDARFWREQGFEAAGELLPKLPPEFAGAEALWFTLKLKEDVLAGLTPEQEFALFRKGAMQESEQALRQARIMKFIAWFVAAVLAGVLVVAGFYLLRFMRLTRRSNPTPVYYPPARR